MKNKAHTITTIIYVEKFYGIKIHKLDYKSIRCIEIPRNLLKQLDDLNNSELNNIYNSGIYFLQNLEKQSLYIGQSDNLFNRLQEHNRTKDFDKVYCFTTSTNDWTKTHIDYLEWHYINIIKKQDTWKVDNTQLREKEPNISEFEKNPLMNIITDIDIILLNDDIKFEKEFKTNKEEDIFYFKEAKLIYSNGKWIMLKDSLISNNLFENNLLDKNNLNYEKTKSRILKITNQIIEWKESDFIRNSDNNFILNRNIFVSSPSFAACIAKGYHSLNGWTEWKNHSGKTLDEIYRK